MDWQPETVAGDDASSIEGSMETHISLWKIPNDDSSYTSAMANYFIRKKLMVLIIFIRWSTRITWWRWWHMPTHLCFCWKGKNSTGYSLTFIRPFDLSLGLNWQGSLSPETEEGRNRCFFIAWWCLLCYHLLWPLDIQDDTGDFSIMAHFTREHVI